MVGRRRGRDVPRLRHRRLPRAHPPGPGDRGRRARRRHARRRTLPDARRHASSSARPRRSTGTRSRREGRLRDVHAQGDPRAARRVRETIAERRRGRRRGPRRRRPPTSDPRERRPHRRSCACGTSFHAGWSGAYAIEEWARDARSRWTSPRSTATATRSSARETSSSASRSRARPPTRWPRCALARESGAQRARDHQRAWARRPRATADGALYTRGGLEICVAATKTFVVPGGVPAAGAAARRAARHAAAEETDRLRPSSTPAAR